MIKISPIKSILLLFPLLIISLTSCYTDYGLTTADYDLVATFYNKSTDFQQFQTFTLLDTIVRVADGGGIGSDTDTRYDQQVLDRIANNLEAYGYTRINQEDVDSTDLPDVFILVSSVSSENYVYYPGYWWGYWGWYPYWGYYPGWGGYYPGGVTYSYSTGSIFIGMLNSATFDPVNKKVQIDWIAAINGLLEDTSSNISLRINDAIDQAFTQSEYLKIN